MRPLLVGVLAAALLSGQTTPDEEACKKALAIPAPAARLAAILQFVTRYPNSRSVPLAISRTATTPELAADILHRLAKASPMARSDAARAIALSRTLPSHDAEAYARQSIADLDSDDFLARERQWHQESPFYPEEAREKFRYVEAAAWSTLGRILIRQGRDADARQALQKSLAAARTPEAAAAFADLAAKRGDTHTVLDALGTAILTGKADRPTIDKFQAAWRDAGMRPDPEQWLDRRYRTESRNPLEPPPYRAAPASPRRDVLLEIFTGAACERCVSVDLAADALLHRYNRSDLVVIAHHAHDPATNPLVSEAADQRASFYELHGAPHVVLDGEPIESGEGLASVAKPIFDGLDSAVQKRIAIPAGATLELHSTWNGLSLNVDAIVEAAVDAARLRLYLVETEVSYSGESGVRLHPMVVRAAARLDEGGFEIPAASEPFRARWTFPTGHLNTARLAVIAVVQDAKTRHVLQSAYLPVEPPQ